MLTLDPHAKAQAEAILDCADAPLGAIVAMSTEDELLTGPSSISAPAPDPLAGWASNAKCPNANARIPCPIPPP